MHTKHAVHRKGNTRGPEYTKSCLALLLLRNAGTALSCSSPCHTRVTACIIIPRCWQGSWATGTLSLVVGVSVGSFGRGQFGNIRYAYTSTKPFTPNLTPRTYPKAVPAHILNGLHSVTCGALLVETTEMSPKGVGLKKSWYIQTVPWPPPSPGHTFYFLCVRQWRNCASTLACARVK